jgi:hypothetical protein
MLRPGTTLVLVLGVSAWPEEPVVLRSRKRIQKIEIGNVGQACCGVARAVSVATLLTLLLNFCKQKKVRRSKSWKVKKLEDQKIGRSKNRKFQKLKGQKNITLFHLQKETFSLYTI